MFCCNEFEVIYKCNLCNAIFNDKVKKFDHICGSTVEKSEVRLKRCSGCRAVSFSSIWQHFHENNCQILINKKLQRRAVLKNDSRILKNNFLKKWVHKIQDKTKKHQNRNYLLENTKKSQGKYECDQCKFLTKFERYLERHKKRKHLPSELQKWYSCDHCDYKTIIKGNLNTHTNRKHFYELQKQYSCDHCEFKTINKNYLKVHIKRHLPVELKRKYECDQCDFKTTDKCNLNAHKTGHLSLDLEKWFLCDQCDYKTKWKRVLVTHIDRRHSLKKKYKCIDCKFTTNDFYYLKKHEVAKHLPIELQKLFECDQCNFKTKYKRALHAHRKRKHIPSETNEKNIITKYVKMEVK